MVGRAEGQTLGALEEGVAVRGLTDIQLTSREALHSIKQISSSQRTQFWNTWRNSQLVDLHFPAWPP
jgi:hypothetical protein